MPNESRPDTRSPPSDMRARERSDAPISNRSASSSPLPQPPTPLNTLVMRVAGTPGASRAPPRGQRRPPRSRRLLQPPGSDRTHRPPPPPRLPKSRTCRQNHIGGTSQRIDQLLDGIAEQLRPLALRQRAPQRQSRPHAHGSRLDIAFGDTSSVFVGHQTLESLKRINAQHRRHVPAHQVQIKHGGSQPNARAAQARKPRHHRRLAHPAAAGDYRHQREPDGLPGHRGVRARARRDLP